jgi:hypothetical protein
MRLLSSTALFLTLAGAHAFGTTVYTDASSFLADVSPGYYLETFDSFPDGKNAGSGLSFSGNGFDYSGSAFGGFSFGNGGFYTTSTIFNGNRNVFLSVTEQGTTMVFDFAANITAVGGTFFMVDANQDFTDGIMTITLADGTTEEIESADTPFFGFTSPLPITSITIDSNRYSGVNDLYVGAAQEAVPEPGMLVLLSSGLAVLLIAQVRKTRLVQIVG